jgi:hypothetical protein
MVSIHVEGKDRAGQFKDWEIFDSRKGLMLRLHFHSGKSYSCPLANCKIVPTRIVRGGLCTKNGKSAFRAIDEATIYGERYAVVRYAESQADTLMNAESIEFTAGSTFKDEKVFQYFLSVAAGRVRTAEADNEIAKNVLRQLEKALPHPDTALHAYCNARSEPREMGEEFIYPFGVNESQLAAVERAFSSQVSLIEGPPGTGKTQTILNIVANILLRGKNVAIVSNNNAAVANVYEKLVKSGLDHVVAKLGSAENRKVFFSNRAPIPYGEPASASSMERIQTVLQELKKYLQAQNYAAQLRAQISELIVERDYLLVWQGENLTGPVIPLEKYGLTPRKTADLMAYLAYLAERRVRLLDRIELLFNFRIFRVKPFDDERQRKAAIHALQLHYYESSLKEKKSSLAECQRKLDSGNVGALLNELTNGSLAYLKQYVNGTLSREDDFDANNYRKNFDAFLKRYPVVGSGSHSILNSVGAGSLIDYVIIDEASQQDIVPGVLAMACARNMIVVGDRKQLPHIPANLGVDPPSEFYDCDKYSLLDSCVGVFSDAIPKTLLKEHYRCHPRIIQFCNQQFYDNQLIPMTHDAGESAMMLVVTAKGNHTRRSSNLREIESAVTMLEGESSINWDGEKARGFIAPYNAQVNLSRRQLPEDFVKQTVHKFQGRECDEIVFSTVLDKKASSQRGLGFVDDPHLVNVAVSRARSRFTIVTGDNVFGGNHGHIAALVRYIEYYSDEKQILRAPVVSAFDLLYTEYDRSLETLHGRLRPSDSKFKSEQIVARVLRDALRKEAFNAMMFHSQVALSQLASLSNDALTPRERDFMRNRASCDFVVYFKVGKMPLGVIEVDGGSHDLATQSERDTLKNSILEKSGLPILRLRTIESRIEERVATFLSLWAIQSGEASCDEAPSAAS